jgi:DNA-binding LacI/PurR family transcriptional regulator
LFFEKHYRNIVYTGLNSVDTNWDQVICDGYEAAKTALEHLIKNGHKRIAYVGETENEIRFSAYKDTLLNAGLDFNMRLVSDCSLDGMGGYAGAEQLLDKAGSPPTAVFCANDITAIAAMKRFSEKGLKIPDDISVIGIDNEELGKTAVRLLVDRINKEHKLPMEIILPHRLILRESTAKAGAF